MIATILFAASAERDQLLQDVAKMGEKIGELKRIRAGLLVQNGLNGNDPEIMATNEKLHNARRVLAAWNRRRENFDFLLNYLSEYREAGTDAEEKNVCRHSLR